MASEIATQHLFANQKLKRLFLYGVRITNT